MRLKQSFPKESPNLNSEIQSFMQDAVQQLKAKNMKIFFANQRNEDTSTTVIVTGLNAVDKPLLASMQQSGFAMIDTQSFGVDALQVDGFNAVNPGEIAQNLATQAKEEDVSAAYSDGHEGNEDSSEPDFGLFLPFSFANPRALYEFVQEVFATDISKEDASFLHALFSNRPDLSQETQYLERYQQIIGQIEAHYSEKVSSFVRDVMVSPQGRWLYYCEELKVLPQTYASPRALYEALETAGQQPVREDIELVYKALTSSSRPPKEKVSELTQQFEQILQKFMPQFSPGDSPAAWLKMLQ